MVCTKPSQAVFDLRWALPCQVDHLDQRPPRKQLEACHIGALAPVSARTHGGHMSLAKRHASCLKN
jgi:hypothetical protein